MSEEFKQEAYEEVELIEDDDDEGGLEIRWDGDNWVWGAALIVVGALFLLNNFGIANIRIHNWWAIFILVPGLNMLVSSARAGRSKPGSGTSSFWGLFMVALSMSFFFDIDWDWLFPGFMILGGIYLLIFRK